MKLYIIKSLAVAKQVIFRKREKVVVLNKNNFAVTILYQTYGATGQPNAWQSHDLIENESIQLTPPVEILNNGGADVTRAGAVVITWELGVLHR